MAEYEYDSDDMDDDDEIDFGTLFDKISAANPFTADDTFEDEVKQHIFAYGGDSYRGKMGAKLKRARIWDAAQSGSSPVAALGRSKNPELVFSALQAEVYKAIHHDLNMDWFRIYEAATSLQQVVQNQTGVATKLHQATAWMRVCILVSQLSDKAARTGGLDEDDLEPLADIINLCIPRMQERYLSSQQG